MFACPGLIFYTVCSVPWLNGNLALAEKCSGPLRFRLRQVLLYFLLLNCNPQFHDRRPRSPAALPGQILIIVGKVHSIFFLNLHPKIQIPLFIFWAVIAATSWYPEPYRGKVFPFSAMKAYKESRDTAPTIISLCTSCITDFYIEVEWKNSCVSRVISLHCSIIRLLSLYGS